MKKITEFTAEQARSFFLRHESYANFDLPAYFNFEKLLRNISAALEKVSLNSFIVPKANPADHEDVNYRLYSNKNGMFAWRPFELIHPAIYVQLVHEITQPNAWKLICKRFDEFSALASISCASIPLMPDPADRNRAASISSWVAKIEQESLALSLRFNHVIETDIADCYRSIYTHSVPWALHTKTVAKARRRDKNLIGNVIDKALQSTSNGQTNGIPQGSVLSDFIAEMVLGYADCLLAERLLSQGITDYQILRFRDDYRILTNNPNDGMRIAKELTEVLIELGLGLSVEKTKNSDNVIRSSIKPDKVFWASNSKLEGDMQSNLMKIHELASLYPNSGSVIKAMTVLLEKISNEKEISGRIDALIGITVDIAIKNPRTYPVSMAIVSKLLSFKSFDGDPKNIFDLIAAKFARLPNTGLLDVWLQRAVIKIDRQRTFVERLCNLVNDPTETLWNSEWLQGRVLTSIQKTPIVLDYEIDNLDTVIGKEEVKLFRGYDIK